MKPDDDFYLPHKGRDKVDFWKGLAIIAGALLVLAFTSFAANWIESLAH